MAARPARFQLLTGAGGEDGLDQRFGYVWWQGSAVVFEGGASKLHGRLIPGQVLAAIHAQAQMVVEFGSGVCGQLACQIVGHEIRELAAGHDGVTSKGILPSPRGFCKESPAMGAIRLFGCHGGRLVSRRWLAKP